MAEDAATEPNSEQVEAATEDMDLVTEDSATNGAKRAREEEEEKADVSKKQKVEDKSVEEERLEKLEGEEGEEKEEEEDTGPVSLGPKSFGSSVEMFDYFYNLLHHWPPNVHVNKVTHWPSFTLYFWDFSKY